MDRKIHLLKLCLTGISLSVSICSSVSAERGDAGLLMETVEEIAMDAESEIYISKVECSGRVERIYIRNVSGQTINSIEVEGLAVSDDSSEWEYVSGSMEALNDKCETYICIDIPEYTKLSCFYIESYKYEDGSHCSASGLSGIFNSIELGAYGPDGEEYDQILARGGAYDLCKKTEAGFSEKKTLYGIYDENEQRWAVDYIEVPAYDYCDSKDFLYIGEGVFYSDYSRYGSGNATFISAPLGGCFVTDRAFETKGHFVNGVLAGILENGYDNEVVLIDPYGKQQSLFDGDDVPQIRCQNQYGIIADSYNGSEHVTYAYWYDGGNILELSDDYLRRMYTIKNDNRKAFYEMTNDSVYFYNMLGDDGKYYYAQFDKNGIELQQPTLCQP